MRNASRLSPALFVFVARLGTVYDEVIHHASWYLVNCVFMSVCTVLVEMPVRVFVMPEVVVGVCSLSWYSVERDEVKLHDKLFEVLASICATIL